MLLRRLATAASSAQARERRLLRGVLQEAIQQQHRKQEALEHELMKEPVAAAATRSEAGEKEAKALAKARRRAAMVPGRLAECALRIEQLTSLVEFDDIQELRSELEAHGLQERIRNFDVDAQPLWGRPRGFLGRVFESPSGVPILVGRQGFSDDVMRSVSRGSDLWLQVSHGRGSRVMLWLEHGGSSASSGLPTTRKAASGTSWYAAPPTRGCYQGPTRKYGATIQACLQRAADLAAYYSEHRSGGEDEEGVEVMYTDSRRVAARGARIGQIKNSKRLGVLRADPMRVMQLVRRVEAEQADLI